MTQRGYATVQSLLPYLSRCFSDGIEARWASRIGCNMYRGNANARPDLQKERESAPQHKNKILHVILQQGFWVSAYWRSKKLLQASTLSLRAGCCISLTRWKVPGVVRIISSPFCIRCSKSWTSPTAAAQTVDFRYKSARDQNQGNEQATLLSFAPETFRSRILELQKENVA